MVGLNDRQQKFVEGVLKGKTYVSAYREAGYEASKDTVAWTLASRLFRNDQVKAEIQRRRDENLAKDMISLDILRADAMIQAQRLIREGTNDDRVKADMVKDILDRAGLKPTDKQQLNVNANVGITLGDIIRRARDKDESSDS